MKPVLGSLVLLSVIPLGCCCLCRKPSPNVSTASCPPDSVKVGRVCVDKYEASVWNIPNPTTANAPLVQRVIAGTVTLADLANAGAKQFGEAHKGPPLCTGTGSDYGMSFPNTGNWTPISGSDPPTPGIYAVSLAGVKPSTCISWFQAAQACALAGKRLPTNQEWQQAAAGTPAAAGDNGTTDCNTATGLPSNTGARANCKSAWGAFDMVGNVAEWVGDWVPLSTDDCPGWGPFSNDFMCLAGAAIAPAGPGAIMRGGSCCTPGANAGVFFVDGQSPPTNSFNYDFGFRCVR